MEDQPETEMKCITEHPGFQSTGLAVWVLETACYRQSAAQIKGEMSKIKLSFVLVHVILFSPL